MNSGEYSPIPLPEKLPVAGPQISNGEVESEEEKKGHVTHPLVLDFLQLAVAHGADEGIIERNKWATIRYLTTDISLVEVTPYLGDTTQSSSRRAVFSTLQALWNKSPVEIQTKYPLDVVLLQNTNAKLKTKVIHSDETKEKIRAARFGKSHSLETKAKMSIARVGKVLPDETKARISATLTGVPRSDEVKAILSEGHTGKTLSDETRAKMRDAHLGKSPSVETRDKISTAQLGKPRRPVSDETRAKLRAASLGKTLSEEAKAKVRAANLGKTLSDETRAKISAIKKMRNRERKELAQQFYETT